MKKLIFTLLIICFGYNALFAQTAKRIAFLHDPGTPVQQVGLKEASRSEGYSTDINGASGSTVTSNTATLTVDSTADYYVSPSGSDHNSGTISAPFYSLNKAWSKLATTEKSGKLIYMRGGTYRYNTLGTSLTGKSGVSGNYIKICAYPGEYPIINYNNKTFTSQLIGIYLNGISYIYLKGIRVTSINQPISGSIAQYGLILWDNVNNCIFEQIETDHIGGWGTVIGDNSTNNLFLNCDSHHNADPYTTYDGNPPYGWSDGFQTGSQSSTNNTFRGCRSWGNSDDGWDLRNAAGHYIFENCWSFHNGYKEDQVTLGGDGEGFKGLCSAQSGHTNTTMRILKNCLAFECTAGFEYTPNAGYVGCETYNCVAYNCRGGGYNFQSQGAPITIKNCVNYNNTGVNLGTPSTHDHNTFDIPITVTDADFVSLNSAGMDGPRQADGSLPKLDFLKLSPTSKLIDAGIDVGLPFAGASPDLGAFETGMVTGISPKEIKNDFFRVYPNPVKEMLSITTIKNDGKRFSLKLCDIRGVQLYKSTETGDCKLDFSRYRSGLYFLQIMSEGNLTIDKIVKY